MVRGATLNVRRATLTVHLGDGNDRIFAHAWNEPGWKNGCVRLALMVGSATASICTKCCEAIRRRLHFLLLPRARKHFRKRACLIKTEVERDAMCGNRVQDEGVFNEQERFQIPCDSPELNP
jgi:hypothetical protein